MSTQSLRERCRCHAGGRRPFTAAHTPRRYPRDRAVDVRHIALDLTLTPETRSIAGSCALTLRPFSDGLRAITLDAKELHIEAVELANSPLRFSHDGASLSLDLGQAFSREQDFVVLIRYRATPRRGLYFILPDEGYPNKHRQAWTQGQDEDARYWFPCFDYPNQKSTTELTARVPLGWFALSNGALQSHRQENGREVYHWRQDIPHVSYLVTLAAGEFSPLEQRHGEIPVVAYVSKGDEDKGQRAFDHTKDMIALFEARTGQKYPYVKYSQIVVEDFIFGGMENTSATTLTDSVLHDELAAEEHSSDPLVAHELAHQWFGDLLTCRDWSHAWLNEGFATYCEALWEEEKRGKDEMQYYLVDMARQYFDEDGSYRRPIVYNRYEDPLDLFDRHLYEKGGVVLHMLRKVLGEDAFWRSLRRYVKDNAQQSVVTRDLISAIEQETGRHLDRFFDQWVFGGGHPEYEVSYSWDSEASLACVTVKQTQEENEFTKLFKMPAVIEFIGSDEKPTRFTLTVEQREHAFYLPLPAEPKDVRFDPESNILKQVKFKKPKSMLLFQLVSDPDITGRIFAAEGLAELSEADATEALGASLRTERFWGVRAEVARQLGKVRSAAARRFLLDGLKDADPRVRRAVAEGLGEFRGDLEVEDALRSFLGGERHYATRGEAARSLGKLRTENAFDAIKATTAQDSWADVIRTGALSGLGHLRDERGIDIAKGLSLYGNRPQGRASAVMALGKLAEEFPARKAEIIDHLIELTEKPGFRVHLALANTLGGLKDSKAIPALERLAAREPDGRVRRYVREAVQQIASGTRPEDAARALRDDLEKLRDENRALRDRIEKLEKR
jgi:aminopeptidase N